MKTKVFGMGLMLAAVVLVTSCSTSSESERRVVKQGAGSQSSALSTQTGAGQGQQASSTTSATDSHGHPATSHADPHGHGASESRVPAFEINPADLKKLPPTLSPTLFKGKQQLAHQVVREIPQTIAQLPCYCYCDQGFGHKSLYSCYVDDHASHCAVCVDEVLLAYRLQKEEKLTPAQIRERIIATYGAE